MNITTFCYTPAQGWSIDTLPALDGERTLVLLFGASSFIDEAAPIDQVMQAYPRSHIVGCSTSGKIYGTKLSDGGVVVGIMQFDQSTLMTATAAVEAAEKSYAAGETVARQLKQPGLKGVLIFSDGLNVNGSELIRGLNAVLPSSVVITGGLAGDGDRFKRTGVIKDRRPQSGFVCAVGLYGDRLTIGHGSKGGWDIFGPERLVTQAQGNVVYELDGKPALQLYKEYLGDLAAGLPATALLFPLALRTTSPDQRQIVRSILAGDETAQSMIFAGDIPQGSFTQLMRANFDRVIYAASQAALMAHTSNDPAIPRLSIAVSCVGRKLILGERTEEELEAMLDVLPAGTQQISFYSYGEIAPYASGTCELHNQTMTLATISEG